MRTRSTCNNISPAVTDHSPRSISCSKTKTTSSEAARGNKRKENMSTNATKSAPKKRRRKHKVASREEWITARKKLLEAEKNLTRRSDKVARQRQKLPWASSLGSDFNFDFDVSFTPEQQRAGIEYNYEREEPMPDVPLPSASDWASTAAGSTGTDLATYTRERPGMSAFALQDGIIHHTYSAYGRGLDIIWGAYQWFDRAPKGRNETDYWWRRHDEYEPL